MLNPFFQQGSRGEQSLVQDLINEQLRMYGVEVHFMPRKYVTTNTILREVIESKFDDAYPMEAYVENFEGYGDTPTLLSKFGIQQTNEITLIISKERFETYISPLIKNEENIKLSTRPKEGDLIYFPLGDRLFEIKYVEHEKPFYQLQKNYVYELRCELFRIEDEVIDTGVDEIDDTLEGIEGADGDVIFSGVGIQKLTLVGAGATATAVTTIVDGAIRFIDITNRGSNYIVPPRVAISSAPSSGVTGIATALTLGGMVVCTGAASPEGNQVVVQSAPLINPGSGYTVAPKIQFFTNNADGTGSGAAGTSLLSTEGAIGIVTITSGGSGYSTEAPTVTFTGVSTVSAAATVIVSAAGTIAAIYITNAGLGYTEPPTMTIGSPGIAGTGNFSFNETITGGTSGSTAKVRKWNSATTELDVYDIDGVFRVGETITGSTSGATNIIRIVGDTPADDGFSDNDNFETEADAILDFTEQNPFGTP
ncbi:neck protein [Synechococcus phage SynMITS9220M01]|nr:neck protein [Synechococcus phage SynMITS9220M01]